MVGADAKIAIVTLPAAATVSPEWGIAMALGLLGGIMTRAGVALEERKSWADIRRGLIVSALISIGSMIATLTFAAFLNATPLGVAAIGFVVGLTGVGALDIMKRFILAPIIGAIRASEKDPKDGA